MGTEGNIDINLIKELIVLKRKDTAEYDKFILDYEFVLNDLMGIGIKSAMKMQKEMMKNFGD